MSDLHLESGWYVIPELPDDKETVLILAGDIWLGTEAFAFMEFYCNRFKHVIYICGNHEFYHNEYNKVISDWFEIEAAETLGSNFTFLHNDFLQIDNVLFFGGTMWTDFNNSDWFSMYQAKQNMNDYNLIIYNSRSLTPENTVTEHRIFKDELENVLRRELDGIINKTIVVSHHLPIRDCVPQQFRGYPLNAAYHANMDELISKNKIDYWFFGHTHTATNFEKYGTRFICNPKGYSGYQTIKDTGFNENLIIEV